MELDYQISSTMIDTCDLKLHGIHFKNACTNAKRCDSERAAFNLRADGNLPESHLLSVIIKKNQKLRVLH